MTSIFTSLKYQTSCILVSIICCSAIALTEAEEALAAEYNGVLNQVMQKVKDEYVEEITDKDLTEKTLKGMLSGLDPHSYFFNEKEYNALKEAAKGEFSGVGLEVTMEQGLLKVVSPYEDGPAFRAGIKSGDYITAIDNQIIRGMSLEAAAEKLRGKAKTSVKLAIFREATNELLDITLVREVVKIIPVKGKIVDGNVGVIKIASFGNAATASFVKKEYQKFVAQMQEEKKELSGLILDLRWNPGGFLDQAKEVVELFLENGVVVSTKGRLPEFNAVYRAEGQDITEGMPIVVLVNAGSASASEIVAGALQDNKRAVIVGNKTFGKGSVQSLMPISGNTGAIKLTVSRYYTPLGRSIQGEGIEPDVEVAESVMTISTKTSNALRENSLNGHLPAENAQHSNYGNRKMYKEIREADDFQLIRAIDLIKGMSLYSNKFGS